MDQFQAAPALNVDQGKHFKTLSNSGRATRFLGLFYFVLGLVSAFSFWKIFSTLRENPSLQEKLPTALQFSVMPVLLAVATGLITALFLFIAGSYIRKQLTGDTVLYLKLVLGYAILLVALSLLRFRISFDLILQLLLIYYAVRGLVASKKLPIDLASRDPKRVLVFTLAVVGALLLVVGRFVA